MGKRSNVGEWSVNPERGNMNIALSFPHRERTITGVRNLALSTIDQTLQIDSVNNYYFLEYFVILKNIHFLFLKFVQ